MNKEKSSKKIAYALRHRPDKFDLDMDEYGAVKVAALAKALGIAVSEVKDIVETDKKGRYIIDGDRIWAAQGHSFAVRVPMQKVTKDDVPKFLYHGTQASKLDSIYAKGLVPGSRNYVHLSGSVGVAEEVGSRRTGILAVIEVDVFGLLSAGRELFLSSNGVYMTEFVDPSFIRWVNKKGIEVIEEVFKTISKKPLEVFSYDFTTEQDLDNIKAMEVFIEDYELGDYVQEDDGTCVILTHPGYDFLVQAHSFGNGDFFSHNVTLYKCD